MVGGEEHSRITWDEYYAGRAKLQESLNINSGLYALQRCIDALIAREQAAGTRAVHVPFSDSKLTMLLHGALGGGARTTVLICASLEPSDAVEAISSLRFGEACSRVESRAARRGDAAAIARLVQGVDGEIAACQALIERDQRWEQRVTIREDRVRMKDNFSTQVRARKTARRHAFRAAYRQPPANLLPVSSLRVLRLAPRRPGDGGGCGGPFGGSDDRGARRRH